MLSVKNDFNLTGVASRSAFKMKSSLQKEEGKCFLLSHKRLC